VYKNNIFESIGTPAAEASHHGMPAEPFLRTLTATEAARGIATDAARGIEVARIPPLASTIASVVRSAPDVVRFDLDDASGDAPAPSAAWTVDPRSELICAHCGEMFVADFGLIPDEDKRLMLINGIAAHQCAEPPPKPRHLRLAK
jgi:hypothetical protein